MADRCIVGTLAASSAADPGFWQSIIAIVCRAAVVAAFLTLAPVHNCWAADTTKEQMIQDALKAAPPTLVDRVTVRDWQGNVLRKGDSSYTCLPTPPQFQGSAPMCMDAPWMEWADAWSNKKPLNLKAIGIAYMLAGDEGSSNIDPYAEKPTATNEWTVEGSHIMIVAPHSLLEGLSTDSRAGGPYVMWKGTPYAHIMVPIGARPPQPAAER
jgi:hypothetical protein